MVRLSNIIAPNHHPRSPYGDEQTGFRGSDMITSKRGTMKAKAAATQRGSTTEWKLIVFLFGCTLLASCNPS